jgi:hypothetical protein
MNEDIPENIHRRLYHKSDKVNAPETQKPEFQAGYWAGVESVGFNATKRNVHCARRSRMTCERTSVNGSGGFWAFRSLIVIFPIKKRPKCYGQFLRESSEKI